MTDNTNLPPVTTPHHFSAHPPARFTPLTDFNLWIQRFELYVDEVGIPPEKQAREILSLLEDEPFRVISQLGLILTDDYDAIKKELYNNSILLVVQNQNGSSSCGQGKNNPVKHWLILLDSCTC